MASECFDGWVATWRKSALRLLEGFVDELDADALWVLVIAAFAGKAGACATVDVDFGMLLKVVFGIDGEDLGDEVVALGR